MLYLAWRHLRGNPLKSLILVACIAATAWLPLAVNLLVARGQARLLARAEATPLLLGAPGSRTDLVLHGLHFRPRTSGPLSRADADAVRETGLAEVIPLYRAFEARGLPIVGASLDYFRFRGLAPARGTLPLTLGDCVLGAAAARSLGLAPGDALLSDPRNVFDIAGAYPLRMHVAGVLAPSNPDDDGAVFVDVKTAWVIAGLGHGHQDLAAEADQAVVLKREADRVVANAALPEYNEITPENAARFHFHGDPGGFPLTAAIVVPRDGKAAALLAGRFADGALPGQLVRPAEVAGEMLGAVFRVKRLFDANVVLVAGATALLLGLVAMLTVRMRAEEMGTLHRIGAARSAVFWLHAWEWVILVGAGGLAAALLATVTALVAPALLPWVLG